MCNLVYVSTDSPADLGAIGSDQFTLMRPSEEELSACGSNLRYSNKWYLACRYGGCSCHFRHFRHLLHSSDPAFGPPEDWCPEDEGDIISTAAFYDVLAGLVRDGYRVDVVDTYQGEASGREREVRLRDVSRTDFRFWEDWRFDLVP